MKKIIPETDLKDILLSVKIPGRYVGGEFGTVKKNAGSDYNIAICFPDLYEIGMSNQAIKILYRELNSLEGISCERVFAPDRDFESLLRINGIPLYTLESGMPLGSVDMIGFSIGYELSATSILSILDAGGVPVLSTDRGEGDPIVIAGGPAITNPLPFSKFLDGVFIGEAEDRFPDTVMRLRRLKNSGGSRDDALDILENEENIWTYGKYRRGVKVRKAVWTGFGTRNLKNLPVASVSTVQDNGIIEIMRGCPNSCRFCHAGFFYRPYRQKTMDEILREADFLVNKCGYNEITLSSLSSGDYSGLAPMIRRLNGLYGDRKVSFSLPSLRINTFTLSLLEEISASRKSGLTFAVETPEESWQRSINKEIDKEKITEILLQAGKLGWKVAKFYFMIGLPGSIDEDEEMRIADFIDYIQKKSGLRINVNVGTFIPKPHTPFQWAPQLSPEKAYRKLVWLKSYFKRNRSIKLSYHTPFVSFLEGVLSRGDERVGDLILSAYRKGARLDAWTEHFDRRIWETVFDEAEWDVEDEICSERNVGDTLPWDTIDIGVNKNFLKFEYRKSLKKEITPSCSSSGCDHNCGICKDGVLPKDSMSSGSEEESTGRGLKQEDHEGSKEENIQPVKYLFKFEKKGKAVYLSHINIMNVFKGAFQRAGVNLEYSTGFNPKPRIEFAHPLSLGISSFCEIASVMVRADRADVDCGRFINDVNLNLPSGLRILECRKLNRYIKGTKKYSLMSLYGGSEYRVVISESSPVSLEDSVKSVLDFIAESGVRMEGFELTIDEDSNDAFYIILPDTGKKVSNIMYILKEIFGPDHLFKHMQIERRKMFIKDKSDLRELYYSVK